MKKITATFVTVTPMFLSGANQKKFELRGASFKGVLRFWWRALAYTLLNQDLSLIHDEECRIFGSAGSGLGLFKIRINQIGKELLVIDSGKILKHNNIVVGDGILYLGYGLIHAAPKRGAHEKGQLIRPCALAPLRFQVELIFRDIITDSVIDALKILGLLGGLGSRSRHGFGSVVLEKLDGDVEWQAPFDVNAYKNEIIKILHTSQYTSPIYTAFSKDSRITIIKKENDAFRILEDIGSKMQLYRSWGNNGRVGGVASEKNFSGDHALAYSVAKDNVPQTHPERIVFGLPHNYYITGVPPHQKKFDVVPALHKRRASPLLIHVHKLGNDDFIGVSTILPSVFLPDNEQIKVKDNFVPQAIDFRIIHKFIDGREGICGAKTGPDYFPDRMDIYP
jgi:CRISPR-associated protein Cmr1